MDNLSSEPKNNKINYNSDENKSISDHEDEEWEDITHCSFQPKITIELSMASGGSHAWSYILEWDDEFDSEPNVYVDKYPFNNRELQKDKIIRIRTCLETNCQSIRLFDYDEEIPEDDEKYEYCCFFCPKIKK